MTSGEGEGGVIPEDRGRGRVFGVAVLALFAAFAVSVRPVLSPFVLYALFLYVVWPRLGISLYRRLAVAGSALAALWVLEVTGLLLAPFLLALILAYVLDPVVDALQQWMPRSAGIATLSLPLLGLLALLVFVVLPAVGSQLSQLISNVPEYLSVVESWIGDLRAWVISLGIQGLNEETVPSLRGLDADAVVQYLRDRQSQLADRGLGAILGIGRGLGTALAVLGYLVLLPILTYYLLRDWDRIQMALAELVPPSKREPVLGFAAEYDRLLHRFLRGQLLLAACVGVLIGVGFWIVDFPYALLLGLVAGVLNIVPYLGLIVSVVVAVLIALFSGTVLSSLVKVALVFGVEQVIENIIGPKIVGDSVGLHPVWVILALALFSFFFGFVGLLIAVPSAVLVKLATEEALQRYRASTLYGGTAEEAAGEGTAGQGGGG